MIIVGADHAGFELKEKVKKFLQKRGEKVVDVGAFSLDENDDFSHFAALLKKAFVKDERCRIISFCGSGVGMNIALNKQKNIRGMVGHNEKEVELARQHNNINALSLSGRTTSLISAKKMVTLFLSTKELKGKYERRMREIEIE